MVNAFQVALVGHLDPAVPEGYILDSGLYEFKKIPFSKANLPLKSWTSWTLGYMSLKKSLFQRPPQKWGGRSTMRLKSVKS